MENTENNEKVTGIIYGWYGWEKSLGEGYLLERGHLLGVNMV